MLVCELCLQLGRGEESATQQLCSTDLTFNNYSMDRHHYLVIHLFPILRSVFRTLCF